MSSDSRTSILKRSFLELWDVAAEDTEAAALLGVIGALYPIEGAGLDDGFVEDAVAAWEPFFPPADEVACRPAITPNTDVRATTAAPLNEVMKCAAVVNPAESQWMKTSLEIAIEHLSTFENTLAGGRPGEVAFSILSAPCSLFVSAETTRKTSDSPLAFDDYMCLSALIVMRSTLCRLLATKAVPPLDHYAPDGSKYSTPRITLGTLVRGVAAAILGAAGTPCKDCSRTWMGDETSDDDTPGSYGETLETVISEYSAMAGSGGVSRTFRRIAARAADRHWDAIAVAGILFGVDFCLADCPVAELRKAFWHASHFPLETCSTQPALFGDHAVSFHSPLQTTGPFAAAFHSPSNWSPDLDIHFTFNPLFHRAGNVYSRPKQILLAARAGLHAGPLVAGWQSYFADEAPAGCVAGPAVAERTARGRVSFSNVADAVDATAARSYTVSIGVHPRVKSRVAKYSFEALADYPVAHILSFGNGDIMESFTIEEVAQTFTAANAFVLTLGDSAEPCHFSHRLVERMKILWAPVAPEFIAAIHRIETLNSAAAASLSGMVRTLRASEDHWFDILRATLAVGMSFRGWPGPPGAYPLNRTACRSIDEPGVETSINCALVAYRAAVARLSAAELAAWQSLPVLHYADGTFLLILASDESPSAAPQTLAGRIERVETAAETSLFSCVRTTSNAVVITAYYLLRALVPSGPEPFDITSLDLIT